MLITSKRDGNTSLVQMTHIGIDPVPPKRAEVVSLHPALALVRNFLWSFG